MAPVHLKFAPFIPSIKDLTQSTTISRFKFTWTTSSMRLTSKTPGMKPAPIPWILCGPATIKK